MVFKMPDWALNPIKFLCIPEKNHLLFGSRKPREAGDFPRRLVVSHVGRVVRTVDNPVSPQSLDGEFEAIGVVDDRIIIKLSEILLGVLCAPHLGLFADSVAVLPAPANPGNKPAQVRQEEADARVAVEDPSEDQTGNGDGRIQWIADEVSQIKLLEPIIRAAHILGVNKDR